MKKSLSLFLAACALNGCIMSGPMALLPPTAKYLMWQGSEDTTEPQMSSISVEQLLNQARSFSSDKNNPSSVSIAYDDYVMDNTRLEVLSQFKTTSFEMICGPYEYGSPLDAAMSALKSCGGIKQHLINRGLSITVRFDPHSAKGQATLKPFLMVEENDA